MRLRDLYFSGLTAVIGSGWLFGSYLTASVAGPASILSWIIGGIFILIIALAWSEISTSVPIAGGAARYTNFTHGGIAASIIAWSTILTYIAVPAVEAVAVVQIMQGAISYYAPSSTLTLVNSSGIPSYLGVVIAAAFSVAFFLVNYIGLRGLIKTNFGMTIWKLVIPPIAVILLLIFGFQHGFFVNFTAGKFAPFGIDPIFSALPATGVVFAFLGFRQPVEMAAEAKSPGSDIWKALVAVVLTGIGVYTLLEVAFIGSINFNSASFGTAGVAAYQWGNLSTSLPMYTFPFFYEAVGLGLGALGIVLVIDGVVSPTGTLSQYMGSTSRVLYGTAKEGYLSSGFFRVSPKHRVPVLGLAVTFIVTLILLIAAAVGYLVSSIGGAWSALTAIVTTTGVFSYIIGPIALTAFRESHPDLKRPFKLPGHKVIALVAFIVSSLMVYWGAGSLDSSSDPYGGLILIIIILVGVVLYAYAKDRDLSKDLRAGWWVIVFLLFNVVLLFLGEYSPLIVTGVLKQSPLTIPGYASIPIDWFIDIVAAVLFYVWAMKTVFPAADVKAAIDRSISLTESAD
jgi:amino acid transporter